MENNDYEWLSVSDVAKRIGKSKQTIYNWCANGKCKFKTFNRGKMIGILIRFPI
jgi:transposase